MFLVERVHHKKEEIKMIDVKYFEVPLPEDVLKEKWSGHFDDCLKLIDNRVKQEKISEELKKRLLLEKEVIERLPQQYPYTFNEMFCKFQDIIPDITVEEIEQLIINNQIEWIYIDGQKYFHDLCVENIIKTRSDYARRVSKEYDNIDMSVLLNDTMKKMKEKGRLKYHYHQKTTIKINKEKEGKKIKVYIPLPLEYRQVSNVEIIKASHNFIESPKDYPARTICIEETYHKGMEFSLEFSYDVEQYFKEYKASEVYDVQPTFYTEELAPHIVFTPYLKDLALDIIKEETNPLLKAQKVYDYITTHVNYSFVRSYFLIDQISEYTAKNLKGDCGLQALLFITLCRILKVPARWQAGLFVIPDSLGNHDWAEIYIAPYGWLPVDCSFGGSAFRGKNEERRQFYFTHLDPFRMPACNDFQVPLYPVKKYQRCDPYDNQTGEVEYEDEGLLQGDFETINEFIGRKEM